MSKYMFYAGRIHHYLKMLPVADEFSRNGHDVLWITSNNAVNIDPPIEYLIKHGVDFNHVYDYQDNQTTQKIYDMYRNSQFAGMHNPHEISHFWHYYSLKESCELIVLYEKALADVDGVFVLHTQNFFTKPLAYIANKLNIPVFSFQEGMLKQRDQDILKKQSGAADFCSKLFVWGEHAQLKYIEAGIKKEIISIVGAPHMDNIFGDLDSAKDIARKNAGIPDSQIVITYMLPFLSEYSGNVNNDINILIEFCKTNSIVLIIRPHPMNNNVNIDGVHIDRSDTPINSILISNIVLGQHSTVSLECASMGVIFAEYGSNILESPGVFPVISDMEDLLDLMDGKYDIDVDSINKLVNEKLGLCDGNAATRIYDEVVNNV